MKIYSVVTVLIIIFSFCFFSSLFYPILNSDNAVTILMIHYFKLPNDLYFWGQDRMGSLIPLLGQIPLKIFNLSALTSESIVHYSILILGFLSFSHFLKSHYLKIIFAIIWFFPPIRLVDITQFSFGIHYSLIAMSCYLFDYYKKIKTQKNLILKHLILFLSTCILITSIWVSDMAIISVFVILTFQVYYYLKSNKISLLIFKEIELYYFILGTIGCYLFINFAKSTATIRQDYFTISDTNTILQTLEIFWVSILDFFKFQANEPFTSVYSYLVLFIIVLLLINLKRLNLNDSAKKMLQIFLFDSIILFLIIIVSNWTFLNGVPRRYFTCTYISLSFSILLLFDNLKISKKQTFNYFCIIIITVCVGGIGSIYNIKYIWPKTLKPKTEVVGEFSQLGDIGIISEYWNSYIVSCVNPDKIVATPHDTTWAVRNYELVDKVFEKKKIYVIRDMWFDTYPDSIKEFGRKLVKVGNEFKIGDCNVCRYKLIK